MPVWPPSLACLAAAAAEQQHPAASGGCSNAQRPKLAAKALLKPSVRQGCHPIEDPHRRARTEADDQRSAATELVIRCNDDEMAQQYSTGSGLVFSSLRGE